MAVSKNARAGKVRGYMGHHEGNSLNTLPKYNYSNGAGWKTGSCKGGSRPISFAIRRKVGGGRKVSIG